MKIKNRSRRRSHKRDGIGVRIYRIRTVLRLRRLRFAYDLVKTGFSELEAEDGDARDGVVRGIGTLFSRDHNVSVKSKLQHAPPPGNPPGI